MPQDTFLSRYRMPYHGPKGSTETHDDDSSDPTTSCQAVRSRPPNTPSSVLAYYSTYSTLYNQQSTAFISPANHSSASIFQHGSSPHPPTTPPRHCRLVAKGLATSATACNVRLRVSDLIALPDTSLCPYSKTRIAGVVRRGLVTTTMNRQPEGPLST